MYFPAVGDKDCEVRDASATRQDILKSRQLFMVIMERYFGGTRNAVELCATVQPTQLSRQGHRMSFREYDGDSFVVGPDDDAHRLALVECVDGDREADENCAGYRLVRRDFAFGRECLLRTSFPGGEGLEVAIKIY